MRIEGFEIWGPRVCEQCGAQPGERCKTPSGRDASLPHRARYPEGPDRTYGKRLRRKLELQDERLIKEARKLPVNQALKSIEVTRMEAFRRAKDAA